MEVLNSMKEICMLPTSDCLGISWTEKLVCRDGQDFPGDLSDLTLTEASRLVSVWL